MGYGQFGDSVRQTGFVTLPLYAWLLIGSSAAILVLFWAWDSARNDYLTEKAEYSAFRGSVEALGKAQEAKNKETVAKQEKSHGDAIKALKGRYADIAAKYDGLRAKAGASAGGGGVSALPDTTRPTDDSARDQRLLTILEHAEKQTGQLIELQEWLRQQK